MTCHLCQGIHPTEDCPIRSDQRAQAREIEQLRAELAAAREERDGLAAVLNEIRQIVAPGAYQGIDFSGHIARIKALCCPAIPSAALARYRDGVLEEVLQEMKGSWFSDSVAVAEMIRAMKGAK